MVFTISMLLSLIRRGHIYVDIFQIYITKIEKFYEKINKVTIFESEKFINFQNGIVFCSLFFV